MNESRFDAMLHMVSMFGSGLLAAGLPSEQWRGRAVVAGWALILGSGLVWLIVRLRMPAAERRRLAKLAARPPVERGGG